MGMPSILEKRLLCTAAEGGDEQTVAALLTGSVPVDARCGRGMSSTHNSRGYIAFGWTALMFACWEGHDAIARLLLSAGASPNRRARWVTPLVLAASHGHPALVRLLLEHGAHPLMRHPKGDIVSALVAAAWGGSLECVRLLLDAGEPPDAADIPIGSEKGVTALMAAITIGHVDMVRLLLSRGADPVLPESRGSCAVDTAIYHANPAVGNWSRQADREMILNILLATKPVLDLRQAAALGNAEVVQELLDAGVDVNDEDTYGDTALWRAVSNGRLEAAGLILERGGQLGRSNQTLLSLAAERGHARMAAYLLDQGWSDIETDGPVALDYAAMNSQADVVRLLLERGVNSNSCDGRPLKWGASRAHAEVLALLLSHGADPNVRDADEATPLIRAMHSYGSWADIAASVAVLLEYGADPILSDRDGRTPLDVAEEQGNEEAADLLRRELVHGTQTTNHQK